MVLLHALRWFPFESDFLSMVLPHASRVFSFWVLVLVSGASSFTKWVFLFCLVLFPPAYRKVLFLKVGSSHWFLFVLLKCFPFESWFLSVVAPHDIQKIPFLNFWFLSVVLIHVLRWFFF